MPSLRSNKVSGTNSTPYRILFFEAIDRFIQPLFHDWCFSLPFVLKTAKVDTVLKKDSKLDYSNFHPISLLSDVEKILEKLMYKREYKPFSITAISITYSVDSGNNILHLMQL